MNEELTMLPVADIYPHPDNPRKDVGDVTELADSVKKRGILQNLTVMPGHWTNGEWSDEGYTTLIGHRRTAAAKQAGIESAPCRIVTGLTKNEQVSMMLEENMQRNDLTIYEQAESFQLMLDLGDTVETLSDKTGFSKATIYHRLNLAKLDHDVIKEKENDESFQMSLKDMYELEKIDDVKERNRILSKATSSSNLKYEVERTVKERERKKFKEEILSKIKELGIPESTENIQWNYSEYEKMQVIELWDYEGARLEPIEDTENVYYRENGYYIYICRKKGADEIENEETEGAAVDPKKKIDKQIDKQIDEKSKCIEEYTQTIKEKIQEFADMIYQEKIKIEDNRTDMQVIIRLCMKVGFENYDWETACGMIDENFCDYDEDEDKEKISKIMSMAKRLPVTVHLIGNLIEAIKWKTLWRSWNNTLNIENATIYMETYQELRRYGFQLEEDELKILKGTHPVYTEIADLTKQKEELS